MIFTKKNCNAIISSNIKWKKLVSSIVIILLIIGANIIPSSYATEDVGAFFNDVKYYFLDIDNDGYNDTLVVEYDVNFKVNNTSEVTVKIELYMSPDVLWYSNSTTYTATNESDYQSIKLGPYQEDADFYFILYLYDGVNDPSDQFNSDVFHLYPAEEPIVAKPNFASVIVDLNDTDSDGLNDTLGLILDVDLDVEMPTKVTVKGDLYNEMDTLVLTNAITFTTSGTEIDYYYLALGPVPTYGQYYAKLSVFLYGGGDEPSDTYTTDIYELYPVIDVNGSFADFYYILEDLDSDGNNDTLTVFFDVNTEVNWNHTIQVTGLLFNSDDIITDRVKTEFNTSADIVDYHSLVFDVVSFSDNYTLKIMLNDNKNDPSDTVVVPNIELHAPTKKVVKQWTILIYMDGDNDLELAAIDDLNEMEAAGGSSRDINIIALVDRTAEDTIPGDNYSDWTTAKYIKVLLGENDTLVESLVLQELGEVNMGDPKTLNAFIHWALDNYPANHTALIIWDHGGGLNGVCIDMDNDDILAVNELEEALSGIVFDFIGFDACVMNSIEVLYELRDNAKYIGASFLFVPFDGYPYDLIIAELHSNVSMSPVDFSIVVTESYVQYYEDISGAISYTVTNVSRISRFIQKLDAFVNVTVENMEAYAKEIYSSIIDTMSYLPIIFIDLKGMLNNLISYYNYVPFNAEAMELYDAIKDMTVIEKDNMLSYDLNGLWIFLPVLPYSYYPAFYTNCNNQTVEGYPNPYLGLDFVQACNWVDFVEAWGRQSEQLIKRLELEEELTFVLYSGDIMFLYIDLPKADIPDQFQFELTMSSSSDANLLVWNELYAIDDQLGFICYSMNDGDTAETIYVSPEDSGRFFIYIYVVSGPGTFTFKVHNRNQDIITTSNTNSSTISITTTTTPTSEGYYPVIAFIMLLLVVPVLIKKRKR